MSNNYGAAYRRAILRQRWVHGAAKGDERAVGGDFETMGRLQAELLRAHGLKDDSALVDIGCGAGRLACALADRPKLGYLGLDVSRTLLASARTRCGRNDWRFEPVAGPAIPAPDASQDFVCAFSVFTHIPDDQSVAYLKEARRVLKPTGVVVFSFLDPEVPQHRAQIRPPLLESVLTRLFWAPNVATTQADIERWASSTGFGIETLAGPERLGQSFAVLKRGD